MSPYDVAELTYETPHRYFSRAVESARRLYGAVAIVSRAPAPRAPPRATARRGGGGAPTRAGRGQVVCTDDYAWASAAFGGLPPALPVFFSPWANPVRPR
jgi:hypothetical protein